MAGIGSILKRRAPATEAPTDELTLFYSSDLHASESCWRKFLAAPRFYKVDTLILGGDLAGKAFVPIVEESPGRWTAIFMGENFDFESEEDLLQLEKNIRFNGLYPHRTTPEDVDRLAADEGYRDEVFARILVDGLQSWCDLADERLPEEVTALVICGNDDPLDLDNPVKQSKSLTFCDEQVVEVGGHEVVSLSYSNRTPWDSPRELDESELYDRVARLADQLEQPRRAIFNLHVPPYDSELDIATKLDEELKPVLVGGSPVPLAVGSTAVRELIEKYQPLLSLHGHIHESKGKTWIGETLAINPGSDYASGRIDGCLVTLTPTEVRKHQLVSG